MGTQDDILAAIKSAKSSGARCTYSSLARSTGIDFYDVREAVEALSRLRFVDINHDSNGLHVVSR